MAAKVHSRLGESIFRSVGEYAHIIPGLDGYMEGGVIEIPGKTKTASVSRDLPSLLQDWSREERGSINFPKPFVVKDDSGNIMTSKDCKAIMNGCGDRGNSEQLLRWFTGALLKACGDNKVVCNAILDGYNQTSRHGIRVFADLAVVKATKYPLNLHKATLDTWILLGEDGKVIFDSRLTNSKAVGRDGEVTFSPVWSRVVLDLKSGRQVISACYFPPEFEEMVSMPKNSGPSVVSRSQVGRINDSDLSASSAAGGQESAPRCCRLPAVLRPASSWSAVAMTAALALIGAGATALKLGLAGSVIFGIPALTVAIAGIATMAAGGLLLVGAMTYNSCRTPVKSEIKPSSPSSLVMCPGLGGITPFSDCGRSIDSAAAVVGVSP